MSFLGIGICAWWYFLIDLGSLKAMLQTYGILPHPLLIQFSKEMLSGLGALHDTAMLHRDLKPSNVLVDERGHCKLTDFGYNLQDVKRATFIDELYTRQSELHSSVYWMAPEVVSR